MESAELLNVKPPAPQTPPQSTKTTNAAQTITTSTPVKAPINKQIETRTSDGRRRITPMFIPPPADTMWVHFPFFNNFPSNFSFCTPQSKINYIPFEIV